MSTAPTEHCPEDIVWWVLQSRPRCEKKIQSILKESIPEVYLPCRPSRREYQSKSVVFEVPLFAGYCFARFAYQDKVEVFRRAPVAGVLSVSDQKHFQEQLNHLRIALKQTGQLTPCPFIETGRRVKITSGKFKGIEGIVRRRSGKSRLILSIDILQRSVEVELEADLVALAA